MSASHADDHRQHVRTYIKVFLALMVLTVATVAVARVQLMIPLAVTVALVIAITKGSLVASFFMHLISEKKVILGTLLLTLAFFLVLMLLPLLGLTDQLTVSVLE